MKVRTTLVSLAVFVSGVVLCLAQDANMGTWKLNEAKSKFGAETSKPVTVVYETAGDNVKVTVDGVDKDGKPAHNVWVGKYDGKDYAVEGEKSYDSRAYTKVDERTTNMTMKKGGKVVATGKIAVSADGKSRVVTVSPSDPKSTAMTQTAVYDKQ